MNTPKKDILTTTDLDTKNTIVDDALSDDDMHVMIYGNLTIKDIETGDILINKRF